MGCGRGGEGRSFGKLRSRFQESLLPPTGADQVNLYRAQRGAVQYTTGGSLSSSSSSKWTINKGERDEPSDWACAALLHYRRELSLAEVQQVEGWLDGLYAVVPQRERCLSFCSYTNPLPQCTASQGLPKGNSRIPRLFVSNAASVSRACCIINPDHQGQALHCSHPVLGTR